MRRSVYFIPFFAFLAAVLPLRSEAGTIVKLAPSATSSAALSVASQGIPAGWKYLSAVDLYIVDDEGQAHLKEMQKNGAVAASEPSRDIRLEALPDDPLIEGQGWATGEGVDVGASDAWGLLAGGERVTVAVIDTGIATAHPDLAPNLWTNTGEIPGNHKDDDKNGYVDDVNGYNFWDDEADVTDENDHGSHMAGIVGAVGDNGLGVAGVDWNARLMALRFTDDSGNGSSSKAIEAIDYAIRNGARIINASWTLKLDDDSDKDAGEIGLLQQAIEKAGEAGVLFVTASGNQFRTGRGVDIDSSPVYPSAFRLGSMISVAAVDPLGRLASYSNYGESSVDLAAPGGSILSTSADGDYLSMTGTSMATAFVSGAAALVYSIDPSLSPAQVKAVLMSSVTAEESLEGKVATGGLINLYEAVSIVQSGSIPEIPATSVSASPRPASDMVPAGGCSLVR